MQYRLTLLCKTTMVRHEKDEEKLEKLRQSMTKTCVDDWKNEWLIKYLNEWICIFNMNDECFLIWRFAQYSLKCGLQPAEWSMIQMKSPDKRQICNWMRVGRTVMQVGRGSDAGTVAWMGRSSDVGGKELSCQWAGIVMIGKSFRRISHHPKKEKKEKEKIRNECLDFHESN